MPSAETTDGGGLSGALVVPLVSLALERGLDASEVLAVAEAELEALAAPEHTVRFRSVLQLWELVLRRLRDPSLPIEIGRRALPQAFGVVGYVGYTRSTAREALAAMSRYHDLINGTGHWHILEDKRVATIEWRREGPRTLGMRAANEQVLASFMTITRLVMGRIELDRVTFRHARPDDVRAHEQHFGVPIVWGADRDAVLMKASQLELRPQGADPVLSAYFDRVAEDALRRVAKADSFALRVARSVSGKLAGGIPSIGDVATDLGTTERTLRRRLAEESVTFRALLERTQHERADELLNAGHSIRDVSFVLGFSDGTAFTRAYRRWTGRAPTLRAQRP